MLETKPAVITSEGIFGFQFGLNYPTVIAILVIAVSVIVFMSIVACTISLCSARTSSVRLVLPNTAGTLPRLVPLPPGPASEEAVGGAEPDPDHS